MKGIVNIPQLKNDFIHR